MYVPYYIFQQSINKLKILNKLKKNKINYAKIIIIFVLKAASWLIVAYLFLRPECTGIIFERPMLSCIRGGACLQKEKVSISQKNSKISGQKTKTTYLNGKLVAASSSETIVAVHEVTALKIIYHNQIT